MTCSLLPGLALRDGTLRAAPQVSELVDLRWEQVDFNHAVLRVRTKPPRQPSQIEQLRCHGVGRTLN